MSQCHVKEDFVNTLRFDDKGLIPVITQDAATRQVLMLAYANEEAVQKTIETGLVHYFSRSRNALWLKGETSGHFQHVTDIRFDCDMDALLILVRQEGAACHTGEKSCFYRSACPEGTVDPSGETDRLKILYNTILHRRDNPVEGSYTNYLFEKGIDKMLKKIGEESAEVIIAAKNNSPDELRYEAADLMYHLSVVLAEAGLTWDDIYQELRNREK